jgi:hypothetical protein
MEVNPDQSASLQSALIEMGRVWNHENAKAIRNTEYKYIIWNNHDELFSKVKGKMYYSEKTPTEYTGSFSSQELNFFDYFEYNHEFRGHNLKKNYGV